jgi:hypothetical protein
LIDKNKTGGFLFYRNKNKGGIQTALDVRYLRGSAEQYEAYLKAGKIVNTNFYYIDGKDLYLGKIKLSNQEDIENAIVNLKLPETYATKAELNNLSFAITNNSSEIEQLKQKVEELESGSNEELVERVEMIELKMNVYDIDIATLKTNVTTLKTISNGIGGAEEPPTIMAAIDDAKIEVKTYVDNALSWQTME